MNAASFQSFGERIAIDLFIEADNVDNHDMRVVNDSITGGSTPGISLNRSGVPIATPVAFL